MRRILALALVALAVLGPHAAARAAVTMRSELTRAQIEPAPADEAPVLILAQRVIDRSWGPPEGTPPSAPVPGLLSEGSAMALSAAVPGAGQLYAGDSGGLWFALAEVAGWTSHWLFVRDADHQTDQANQFVGVPSDPASAWSLDRWQQANPTGDPSVLKLLYAGDRESYYNLIVRDPTYLAGWKGPDPGATRADFQHLRDLSDGSRQRMRATENLLWVNHVIAAFGALRAARIHNMPIRHNLELQIHSSWHGAGPTLSAALEQKF
jgi:hypothetical protein